jgi:hypothetical protein
MLKLLGSDIALHPEKGWQLLLYSQSNRALWDAGREWRLGNITT